MTRALRGRILLLAAVGIVLIGIVALWPSEEGDIEGEDDPPCLASRIGLPCR